MLDFRSCGMFPFVPAPSIGDGAAEKRADLFESAAGRRVSACSGLDEDAQDSPVRAAGYGRLLLVRFLPRGRK